jgi:hypothetical protein
MRPVPDPVQPVPADEIVHPVHDLYDVIRRRRDVRGQFNGEPADPATLGAW